MNKNILITISLFILFVSCKTTKHVEKIETVKNDSIVIKSVSTVQPNILSSLVINEICDSITAQPKEFKQVFVIGKDTVVVEMQNNDLNIEINRLEQLIAQKDSVFQSTFESSNKELEVVTNKVSFKFWFFLIFGWSLFIVAIYFLIKQKLF